MYVCVCVNVYVCVNVHVQVRAIAEEMAKKRKDYLVHVFSKDTDIHLEGPPNCVVRSLFILALVSNESATERVCCVVSVPHCQYHRKTSWNKSDAACGRTRSSSLTGHAVLAVFRNSTAMATLAGALVGNDMSRHSKIRGIGWGTAHEVTNAVRSSTVTTLARQPTIQALLDVVRAMSCTAVITTRNASISLLCAGCVCCTGREQRFCIASLECRREASCQPGVTPATPRRASLSGGTP